MHNKSYWLDIPYIPRPSLHESLDVDVVVIGGGITGVSAAYHAVRAGFSTVLIESNTIASGSAGKNGGMVVEGVAVDFAELLEHYSTEDATAIWRGTIAARETVVDLVREHTIDCGLERVGSAYVGTVLDRNFLEHELQARREHGFDGLILQSEGPLGTALLNPNDCVVQPALFVRGLAKAAESLGCRIFENTPVVDYSKDNVHTKYGTIHARRGVIVAIESQFPVAPDDGVVKRELGLVTEPLSADALGRLGWNNSGMFWNISEGEYISVRRIHDRIFLNGGGLSIDATEQDMYDAATRVINNFLPYFPLLKKEDIVLSHMWSGLLLYPKRLVPRIVTTDGWYALYGNGGNGLTNGIMLGQLVVRLISGEAISHVYR